MPWWGWVIIIVLVAWICWKLAKAGVLGDAVESFANDVGPSFDAAGGDGGDGGSCGGSDGGSCGGSD